MLVAAAALLLSLSSAGLGAAALGGGFNLALDGLTHAALPLTVAALAGLAGSLVSGAFRREIHVLAGIGIVLNGGLILSTPRGSALAAPGETPPDVVTIVQFNAWQSNRSPERSADWVLRQNADFLLIEEGSRLPGFTERLAARYSYQVTCAPPSECPVVIFAKTKPLQAEGYWAPVRPMPFAHGRFQHAGGELDLIAVHMARPIPPGVAANQRRALKEVAARFPAETLILGGDFNAAPWSFGLRRLTHELHLRRASRLSWTWPAEPFTRLRLWAPAPFAPIDHVFAGDGWSLVKAERGPAVGSDHYPLLVVLSRNPTASRR